MNQCPLCKRECSIIPADWSGGRMAVECPSCGSIEVGKDNYQKIMALPEDHWQMKILRDGIGRVNKAAVITKNQFGVFQVEPLKSRLTKMEKRSLRRKAEGKHQVLGQVIYTGNDGNNDK